MVNPLWLIIGFPIAGIVSYLILPYMESLLDFIISPLSPFWVALAIPVVVAIIVFGIPIILFIIGFLIWYEVVTKVQHRDLDKEACLKEEGTSEHTMR